MQWDKSLSTSSLIARCDSGSFCTEIPESGSSYRVLKDRIDRTEEIRSIKLESPSSTEVAFQWS